MVSISMLCQNRARQPSSRLVLPPAKRDASALSANADSDVTSIACVDCDGRVGVEMSKCRRKMLLEHECFKVKSWAPDIYKARYLVRQKLFANDETHLNNYLAQRVEFLA